MPINACSMYPASFFSVYNVLIAFWTLFTYMHFISYKKCISYMIIFNFLYNIFFRHNLIIKSTFHFVLFWKFWILNFVFNTRCTWGFFYNKMLVLIKDKKRVLLFASWWYYSPAFKLFFYKLVWIIVVQSFIYYVDG